MKIKILLLALILGSCSSNYMDGYDKTDLPNAEAYVGVENECILSCNDVNKYYGFLKNGDNMILRCDNKTLKSLDTKVRTKSGMGLTKCSVNSRQLNSVSLSQNGHWNVLDISKSELIESDYNGKVVSNYKLPNKAQNLSAVRVGKYIVSTGMYKEGRYYMYNTYTKEGHYFLDYPKTENYPDIQPLTKSLLYASNVLKAHPVKNMFVCADISSGVLDVCKITNDSIKLVKRLLLSLPNVNIDEEFDFPMVTYTAENLFGFTDVTVNNNAIYALYSGNSINDHKTDFQTCKTLLKLDWNGEINKRYELGQALLNINYDRSNRKLYSVIVDDDSKTATLVNIKL